MHKNLHPLQWVLYARRFIATGEHDFLDQAIDACEDIAVRRLLCCRELREERQVPPDLFQPLVKSLRLQNSEEEAVMVEILGLHMLGMLAESPELLQPEMREYVRSVCNYLACASEDASFIECEALYAVVLGTYAMKGHDWQKAEYLLSKSVGLWRVEATADPTRYRPRLAEALVSLGYVLSDLKRFNEASLAINEALAIDRERASSESIDGRHHMVISLLALGTSLHADHHLKESRAAFEEALDILRELATKKSCAYQSDLAIILNNLGAVLMEENNLNEAENVYKEALQIRRALAKSGEPTCRSNVATTLSNLGNLLQEVQGRFEDASKAYQEALAIRRSVAAIEGRSFCPRVAAALCNYALLLEKQGQMKDAVAARREAVETYRQLVTNRESVFQPDLVRSINGLAGLLFELGNLDEARLLREEALTTCRNLDASYPGRYDSELATTIFNLAMVLLHERRVGESHKAFQEALVLYRHLADLNPISYRASVASALCGLGMALHMERRVEAAMEAYRESLAILRALAVPEAEACEDDLADTLNALAQLMKEEQNLTEAGSAFEEALRIYRRLAARDPVGHRSSLALTLSNFGALLYEQRRFVEAIAVCEEALEIFSDLIEAGKKFFLCDVARTWSNLGAILEGQRRVDDSCNAFEKALTIYRSLDASFPGVYHPELSLVLNNLGVLNAKANRLAKAGIFHREALAIRRSLTASAPETYQPCLSQTLNNLANVLASMGQFQEASEVFGEAMRIRRNLIGSSQAYRAELAGTLSNMACLLAATGKKAQAMERAEEAIRVAEGSQDSPMETWLAKGTAVSAYRLQLSYITEKDNPDRLFRYLSALREGHVLALGSDEEHSLVSASCALVRAKERLGTRVKLLIAETLFDGKVLLGVLGSGTEGFCTEVADKLPHLSRRLLEEIETVFSDVFTDPVARNRTIDALASEVWDALPTFVQAALVPEEGSYLIVSGDPYWAAFPWEALRFGKSNHDRLGLHRCLPRWSPLTAAALDRLGRRPFGKGLKTVSVVAPWDTSPLAPLHSTLREAQGNEHVFRQMGYDLWPHGKALLGIEATDEEMNRILAKPPSVIHFTGHGSIESNEEVLILWDHRMERSVNHYGRMQFVLLKKLLGKGECNLLQAGPLVVLNSCFSGRTRDFGGQREDLVWAFLQEGAEAVIASPLPVHDSVGQILGSAIYDNRLASLNGIGETLLMARRRLAETVCREDPRVWPSWMLITCHGNPFAYLPHLHGEQLGMKE
jgi:tetratricopeptide (TPR) repeat protein